MRLLRFLSVLLAVGLLASACGGDDAAETTDAESAATTETTAAETTTTAEDTTTTAAEEEEDPLADVVREAGDLVIWADDKRAPALRPFAEQFGEDNGITVVVQELVPFEDIDDRVTVAGPAGEGPDIFVGAHDQLGGLVASGIVAPVDLGAKASLYAPAATAALNYDGANYGLPYSIENIALIRNTDLVPEAPATWAELEEIALGLQADGTVEVPLAIQEAPGDPFHNMPLFTAFGGYVFGENADGSLNPDDVGIDSPGGLAAAEAFGRWSESGLINGDLDYTQMLDSFGTGQAPFAITGPWAIPDFGDVNFVVEPFPTVDGGEARPFVGVQALMVSAFAENPLLAQTFLLDFMATEEAALALFDVDPRPPALLSALEQVSSDPNILGFGEAGKNGTPMPAIPEMGSVWQAWTDAYELIFTGEDPDAAFTGAAEQIRNLIAEG
ncbi:MAG: maltose ABC transporter substrate-binding protein [Acidimicrobiales bacterium]